MRGHEPRPSVVHDFQAGTLTTLVWVSIKSLQRQKEREIACGPF